MTISDVDEILAQLYFRLNGYFTAGLILYSPEWGQRVAQTAVFAVCGFCLRL